MLKLAEGESPPSSNYTMNFVDSQGAVVSEDAGAVWKVVNERTAALIAKQGTAGGFTVSAYNGHKGDECHNMLITWDTFAEEALEEQMRPDDCCCTIF